MLMKFQNYNKNFFVKFLFKGLQHSSAEFSKFELQLITKTNFWQASLTQLFHSLWPWTDDMNRWPLISAGSTSLLHKIFYTDVLQLCNCQQDVKCVIKTQRGRGAPPLFFARIWHTNRHKKIGAYKHFCCLPPFDLLKFLCLCRCL